MKYFTNQRLISIINTTFHVDDWCLFLRDHQLENSLSTRCKSTIFPHSTHQHVTHFLIGEKFRLVKMASPHKKGRTVTLLTHFDKKAKSRRRKELTTSVMFVREDVYVFTGLLFFWLLVIAMIRLITPFN